MNFNVLDSKLCKKYLPLQSVRVNGVSEHDFQGLYLKLKTSTR
jgi:hypothetical protein